MIRKIIRIDESKCNGCGACAAACHEGAIQMVDGVARLTREDYCDGLGDCLPACPTGAISFEEREAPAYDEAAVKAVADGKMDKDTDATANNLAKFDAAGNAVDAGVSVGGATLAADPAATVLATEAAIEDCLTWKTTV